MLVTGIALLSVTSSFGRSAKWRWIWAVARLRVWMVTSIGWSDGCRIPQSAAAERWLSTEPGPQARTAASHRPSRGIAKCPTA